MNLIVGLIIVFASVLGGYVLHHGKLGALYQPTEFLIIAGGAFGAFFIATPLDLLKKTFSLVMTLLGGSAYSKQKHLDLLSVMYGLFNKIRKDGLIALERDIDDPHSSPIFSEFPSILKDHHAIDFIADYFRLMVGGSMNAFEIENLMDVELETHHQEAHAPIAAVQSAADGLPAFGIVAAVLGVVITMSKIGGPPAILGQSVGAALVGTMLGILLSYGIVAPIATALSHRLEEEAKFYLCIKTCIIAYLNGYSPQVAIEFGRKVLPSGVRPGFTELEEHIKKK